MDRNRRPRPDSSTADRLLAGQVGPDDAPPGYRKVATLLGEAGGGFSEPAVGADGTALFGVMAAAIQAAPVAPALPGRKRMLRKILAAKTVAIASVLALSASGAAAATGNLPDAAQDKVANAAKHVGLNLPYGTERITEGCNTNAETALRNRGQYLKWVREHDFDNLDAAKASKCVMPVVSQEHPDADEGESGNNGQGGTKGKSGEPHGKPENPGQSGDDHGAPAENPAGAETPAGSIETGDDASGDANEAGSGHAEQGANNGADNADQGSGNAGDHPSVGDLPVPVPGS